MARECKTCNSPLPTTDSSHNKKGIKYPDYCNLYCFEADRLSLTKIPGDLVTGSQHHSGMMFWPRIEKGCDWCGTNFELTYGKGHHSNKTFCSRSCYHTMSKKSKRKPFAKYLILRNLSVYHDKVFTAEELGKLFIHYPQYSTCCHPNYIGATLRVYISRGIVCTNKDTKDSTEKTVYWINGLNNTKPIGQWV